MHDGLLDVVFVLIIFFWFYPFIVQLSIPTVAYHTRDICSNKTIATRRSDKMTNRSPRQLSSYAHFVSSAILNKLVISLWLFEPFCRPASSSSPIARNRAKRRPSASGTPDWLTMATYTCRCRPNPFRPNRFEHRLDHLTCNTLHVMLSKPCL